MGNLALTDKVNICPVMTVLETDETWVRCDPGERGFLCCMLNSGRFRDE